nr:DEAD/DEAH box helicase [uncultured Clostridium sp.]
MLFKDLNIIEPIEKAIKEVGYEKPTPIQGEAIPHLLKGKDLLGCAQTGTGKTASFAIPVLQNMIKEDKEKKIIKALVLAPTRELAIQINENFELYSKYVDIKTTVIFGGVSQKPQTRKLKSGVDILIATPGRLLDLINQKFVDLSNVDYLVLDEADRMFDMGMVHDVKKIISKLPRKRQNILFSATMPKSVMKLVNEILVKPVKVEITPESSTVDTVTQGLYFVDKKDKKHLLAHIIKNEDIRSLLVFTKTKHRANTVVKDLDKIGIESAAIHGNKSQNARQLALSNFKEGKIKVLVATDIAARGIDVEELSHVINYDLPDIPETYVHRIGRTGRAGNSGVSLSFCDVEERNELRDIEKTIGKKIPVIEGTEFDRPEPVVEKKVEEKKSNNGRRYPNRNNQGKSTRNSKGNGYKKSNPNGEKKTKVAVEKTKGTTEKKAKSNTEKNTRVNENKKPKFNGEKRFKKF